MYKNLYSNGQYTGTIREMETLVEKEDLFEMIWSGKLIMGADIVKKVPIIAVRPDNAFMLDKKHRTLLVYVGKNNADNPAYIDLYLDLEIHLPACMKEAIKDLVEQFMFTNYDVFYLPDNILSKKKPFEPVPQIFYS